MHLQIRKSTAVYTESHHSVDYTCDYKIIIFLSLLVPRLLLQVGVKL